MSLIDTMLGKIGQLMPVLKTLDGVLTVIHRLRQWGYLIQGDEDLVPATVEQALLGYQRRWGLTQTGRADEETVRLMARRFCSCPDTQPFTAEARGLPKWASNSITFSSTLQLRQPALQAERDTILREIFAHISSRCGLTITLVTGNANIQQIGSSSRADRQLDGAGGTLAYAYIPRAEQPVSSSLGQVVDLDERWSRKMLWLTVAHETLHNAGVYHNEDAQVALMDPHLNMDLDGLQEWDIDQLVQRYGKAASVPTPPPSPIPVPAPGEPPEVSVMVKVGGVSYVVKETMIRVPA